jgi:hypothetical protein
MQLCAFRRLVSVLVLAVALSGSAAVCDCIDYTDYPHWIAQLETNVSAWDIVVEGDLAYLAVRSAGVVVVDVSDPEHPVQIGAVGGAITADKLVLVGQYLFVADGYFRLVNVVDVSDPTAPYVVTQVPTGVYPKGLAVMGDHLYVAVQDVGVVVFDIGDPTAPLELGTLPEAGTFDVNVAAGLLYVNSFNFGVGIYDLVDPAAPSFVDRVQVGTQNETWDTAVRGHNAYVVGASGMWVLDVSDPAKISVVGTNSWWATDITIAGDLAYLSRTGVDILDLTDPEHPMPVTYLSEPSLPGLSWVRGVSVDGSKVFAAADDAGLMVGDLPQVATPPRTTVLGLPMAAERIRPWNNYLLVADQTAGLLVIDVTDPESPDLVGTLVSENARAVISDGDLAYLADGGDGLKIVDLAVPAEPSQIGHLDTYSRVAAGLDLADGYVYLAADLNDLMIIDVTKPKHPGLLAQLETPGRAQDVCVIGDYAFVAADEGGLQVLDITDPAVPFIAGSLDLPGRLQSLVWDGTSLFVGGFMTGLWAVDITAPTAPEVTGWLPFAGHDLALDGDLLLAAGGNGVHIVDRSDPAALISVGFLPTVEGCLTVAVTDGCLFAAGDSLHAAARHCTAPSGVRDAPTPVAWAVLGAHPNPFNPLVAIEFELSAPQAIRLEVVDLAGRHVATLTEGPFAAGQHIASWGGRDDKGRGAPSGIYFLVLRGEAGIASRKVTLVR